MRRRRRPLHPAVLTIAVLHLVGAAWGLCIFTFHASGLQERLKEVQRQRLQQQHPGVVLVFEDEMHPELQTLARVELAVNAVFSLMVLAAGVGLLLRQGWARWLSVVYAVLSILFKIGDTVAGLAYLAPEAGGPLVNRDEVVGQLIGFLFMTVAGVAYAAAVLVVMFLPSVARSLRRERIPVYYDEDEYDDEDEDDLDEIDEDDYPRYRRR